MGAIETVAAGLEAGLDELLPSEQTEIKTGVGILIRDPMNRRLIETATTHLDLQATELDEDDLDPEQLASFELIIAEATHARHIQDIFLERERRAEGLHPAIVVVYIGERPIGPSEFHFDGVLHLPLEPAPLVAQLSLMLYAHRAFARKYHSALEELNLNRRIFRSVTSGISVANATQPDIPLVYVNPAFEVMTGYSLEQVVGRNCRFLQGEDTDQPGLTIIREAIRERREAVPSSRTIAKTEPFSGMSSPFRPSATATASSPTSSASRPMSPPASSSKLPSVRARNWLPSAASPPPSHTRSITLWSP